MKSHLWGPYSMLPDCRLWLAENRYNSFSGDDAITYEKSKSLLNSVELERWNRYRPGRKKQQFLFSRVAVRDVLIREFGEKSRDLRLNPDKRGRPEIIDSRGERVVSISLSHSENLTAILLSNARNNPGVDIEVSREVNARSFSLSFVNEYEHNWIQKESFSNSAEVMLAIWTLKESLWKAMGGPEETSLQDIVVDYRESELTAETDGINLSGVRLASHFFGQSYSFPGPLRNFSLVNLEITRPCRFIGCVVNLGPDLQHD